MRAGRKGGQLKPGCAFLIAIQIRLVKIVEHKKLVVVIIQCRNNIMTDPRASCIDS